MKLEMKKMLQLTGYFFCLTACFISCTHEKNRIQRTVSNEDLHIIDIEKSDKKDQILLSSLFSEVKPIILETGEPFLLGEINGIQVYKDWLFILDNRQNIGVYVFDKDGKFIRKFGNRGNGPDEYLTIADFTIDAKNDVIYLLDSRANKILKYKLSTGKFESSLRLQMQNVQSFHLQYNDGQLYTDIDYMDGSEPECMLMQIDASNGKQTTGSLNPAEYNRSWNGTVQRGNESFFYSRNQKSLKFVHFFMDTIVSISNGQITPAFVLKDKDWVTVNDVQQIKNDRDTNKGMVSFQDIITRGRAFNINNWVEWPDFVCFRYQKGYSLSYVLYHIATNSTQSTNILIDDLVFTKPALAPDFGCADSDGLYGYISVNRMNWFLEQINNECLNPNLDKLEELKSLSEDANPVIFYYEYKQ
jgi:hypothetical protein